MGAFFQNEKVKEVAEQIQKASAPLEEKVDSIWFKIGHSKYTYLVVLGIAALIVFF